MKSPPIVGEGRVGLMKHAWHARAISGQEDIAMDCMTKWHHAL